MNLNHGPIAHKCVRLLCRSPEDLVQVGPTATSAHEMDYN